jgi:hypothetical protein
MLGVNVVIIGLTAILAEAVPALDAKARGLS